MLLMNRRVRLGLNLFVVSLVLLPTTPAAAAAGALDTTFGGDGVVTTDFVRGSDWGVAVAIQGGDGKAVVVGVVGADRRNARFGVARYDVDGALDPTFGGDGKVITDFARGYDEADAVAIQLDGRIVVAGLAGKRIAVARYSTTGALDPTFGGDGKVMTDLTSAKDFAYGVEVQETDGKIVVAGHAGGAGGRFAVARYETDGLLDPAFGGGDGWVSTNFTTRFDYADDLAIQPNGMIVAAGGAAYDTHRGKVALARYDATGVLDATFGGGDGKVVADLGSGFDAAFSVVVQPADSRIVAAGQAGGRLVVLRYDTDGMPDATFSGDGRAFANFTRGLDYADEVVIQSDDKIVAAGAANFYGRDPKFALARYGPNGALDPSFGGDGKIVTNIAGRRDGAYGLAIQPDGKLVASGYAKAPTDTRFAVVRYLAD
jgi:uncharacterized delta-60 repeat protein